MYHLQITEWKNQPIIITLDKLNLNIIFLSITIGVSEMWIYSGIIKVGKCHNLIINVIQANHLTIVQPWINQ